MASYYFFCQTSANWCCSWACGLGWWFGIPGINVQCRYVDIPCSLQSLSLTRGSDFKLIYAMVGKDSDLNNVSTIEYAYFSFLHTHISYLVRANSDSNPVYIFKKSLAMDNGFGMVTLPRCFTEVIPHMC